MQRFSSNSVPPSEFLFFKKLIVGNSRREEKDLGQLMKSITENQLHEVKEAHIADKEKGKDKSILKSN